MSKISQIESQTATISAHVDDMPKIVGQALGNQGWNDILDRVDRIEAIHKEPSVVLQVIATWKRLPQDKTEVTVEIAILSGILEDKRMTDLMTNLMKSIKAETDRCWGS
jgi:hypothetical protein